MLKNIIKITKALTQIRFSQLCNFVIYRILLVTGLFRLITPSRKKRSPLTEQKGFDVAWFYTPPPVDEFFNIKTDYLDEVILRANEIVNGSIRFFEGELQPLDFHAGDSLQHWSDGERQFKQFETDIKFLWEPARFNWAVMLGRAYHLTADEQYAVSFKKYCGEFLECNPVNQGSNWQSGQEIALRLMALVICLHLFSGSSQITDEFKNRIITAVIDHAERIPKTIFYAKAQNNNHLISEAVGLYTAGVFLRSYPKAQGWKNLSLRWFNQAITSQVDSEGEYIQHSTNYHRMMLALCLWMQYLLKFENISLQTSVSNRIKLAAQWLFLMMDRKTGRVPNLGHNDGSFILPFSTNAYSDYRPIVQASFLAFFNRPVLTNGEWDDLSVWLNLPIHAQEQKRDDLIFNTGVHRIGEDQCWAVLRAKRFTNRPAHADQLHVDMWHEGINLLCDAGTFQYNAFPPWDNRLSSTLVHNTICVNNQDQMLRAGRFLWLDWAQAQVEEKNDHLVIANHNGYRSIGLIHTRHLEYLNPGSWEIRDKLIPNPYKPQRSVNFSIQWLTQNWPYQVEGNAITITTPVGKLTIEFSIEDVIDSGEMCIIRAGSTLVGSNRSIIAGWISPTYGCKIPALSIQYHISTFTPVSIISHIKIIK